MAMNPSFSGEQQVVKLKKFYRSCPQVPPRAVPTRSQWGANQLKKFLSWTNMTRNIFGLMRCVGISSIRILRHQEERRGREERRASFQRAYETLSGRGGLLVCLACGFKLQTVESDVVERDCLSLSVTKCWLRQAIQDGLSKKEATVLAREAGDS